MVAAGANTETSRRGRPARWPKLAELPVPMKVLLSAMLLTLALALIGALGQVIVHDIIPTFFEEAKMAAMPSSTEHEREPEAAGPPSSRGDLFSTAPLSRPEPASEPFYQDEQFVWLLKWTHIHLFGMNMIFIFLGAITVFLDMRVQTRCWLVALPFVGVALDIAAMWLKVFVSPIYFWLHLPGGGLFVIVFIFVFFRALAEMWWQGRPLNSVGF